jgi:hypothetical protein
MMLRFLLLAAASVAVLGGCASTDWTYSPRPEVTVSKLLSADVPAYTVTPANLVFLKRGEVPIVWTVNPDSPLRFPKEDGIYIDGEIRATPQKVPLVPKKSSATGRAPANAVEVDHEQKEVVDCHGDGSGLKYICRNINSRIGTYKYTIHLTDGSSDYVLDPMIANW